MHLKKNAWQLWVPWSFWWKLKQFASWVGTLLPYSGKPQSCLMIKFRIFKPFCSWISVYISVIATFSRHLFKAMTVEQIDASATRSFFFVYYRVASKILYLYNKDTKKVKVRTSSPLFFLNCWVSISDNRGIVASEDNKKLEENLQPHNNVWKCVEKLSMKKIHSNAFIS